MKAILSCAAILLIGAWSAPAQQPEEGWSKSGQLKFEVRGEKDADKEVWILPQGDRKGEPAKLAETMGWGNLRVHISPDDKTIVLEDGGGSLGIDLRVFRADRKGGFAEMREVSIGNVLEAWALKKSGAGEGKFLGHRYVKLHGWSPDGKKALVSISGHDPGIEIPGWFAIYDLESGELGFDLEGLNG